MALDSKVQQVVMHMYTYVMYGYTKCVMQSIASGLLQFLADAQTEVDTNDSKSTAYTVLLCKHLHTWLHYLHTAASTHTNTIGSKRYVWDDWDFSVQTDNADEATYFTQTNANPLSAARSQSDVSELDDQSAHSKLSARTTVDELKVFFSVYGARVLKQYAFRTRCR
jgi:hypothetical protein